FLYRDKIETQLGSVAATVSFIETMRSLIKAMTSRCISDALRPGDHHEEVIRSFLSYMNSWEHTAGSKGFLSSSTAEGLRVTLTSTLHLLKYLTTEVGFRYLMTSRLCQDPIERLFGIVRQMSGCNDHPTASQFLISVNTLSFQNLARSPAKSNVSSGLTRSLLDASSAKETSSQRRIDELLDIGNLTEAYEVLSACDLDHRAMCVQASDSRLIFYVAGYVARKSIATTKCAECCQELLQNKGLLISVALLY
ncbi:uncharacterized protein LOC144133697, partial [Amblyomma americanum]